MERFAQACRRANETDEIVKQLSQKPRYSCFASISDDGCARGKPVPCPNLGPGPRVRVPD